jgi:mannose-1-phosphate guanylyltransferase / mannose-6-phosphate isomerase
MIIVPTIMCGGAGTRLWPASRESMPKHLLPMLGGLSTFQRTVTRFRGEAGFGKPVVITSAESRFLVGEQLAAISVEADIILEPSRQDSAAAVATGAIHIAATRGQDAICLMLAADHLIHDTKAFCAAAREAAIGAATGRIMTLGIKPTVPATGYGYIAPGETIAGTASFVLREFREKPDAATATGYITKGYLWNSGNFLFQPRVMLAELEAHVPAILAAAKGAYEKGGRDTDFIRLDADVFKTAPKISIDFAVMEKTKNAGVTPYNSDWSDIGTWDALWEASPQDDAGNVISGDVKTIGVRRSLVQSDGTLTTVVGLDDVVVVATKDAVLVSSRARSAEVKELVAALRADGRKEADEHNRMFRPWGWYQRIDIGPRFQAKRIHVIPGGRLSLQKHFHRAEHWVVIQGTAEVTVDKSVSMVRENEAIHLPLGCVHRMVNPGKIPLEIIEVQIGSYTGEDDIVRIEDVYGR